MKEFFDLVTLYGIIPVLFIYQMYHNNKRNDEREQRYQALLSEALDKYKILYKIDNTLDEIKERVNSGEKKRT